MQFALLLCHLQPGPKRNELKKRKNTAAPLGYKQSSGSGGQTKVTP